MGLLVYVPKAGFGNTNDGNISGVEVISGGNSIDVRKFESYVYETASLFTNLYDWHQPFIKF